MFTLMEKKGIIQIAIDVKKSYLWVSLDKIKEYILNEK